MKFSKTVNKELYTAEEWESLVLAHFSKTYLAEVSKQCQKIGKEEFVKIIQESQREGDAY